MSKIKRSFYNYVFISGSYCLMIGSGIASTVILARVLGPHDYGRYNLFIFCAQLVSLFSFIWILNPAAAKFYSEEYVLERSLKKTFSSEFLLMLANTLIAAAVFYLIRGRVSAFLGFRLDSISVFIFAYLVVTAVFNLFYFGFQGSLDFKVYAMMPLVRSVLFILLLGSGLLFKGHFGLGYVVGALIVSYLATITATMPKLKNFFPFVFDKNKIIDIAVFSWPMIFFAAGNFALDWVDKYLIRTMVSVYAVGIYAAAWNLTTNLVVIPQQLYTIVMPLIAAYRLEKKRDNIRLYLNRLVPQFSFFFSVLIAGLIALSGIFIPLLYGRRYAESVNIFILLAMSSLFMGIKYFYNPVSTVFNFIKLTGMINFSAALLCVALNYLFISRYGMIGAAAATAASSLLACAAVMFTVNKQFDLVNFSALYSVIPAALIAAVCLLAKSPYVKFLLAAAVIFPACFMVKKYRLFSASDIELLRKVDMPAWLKHGLVKFYGFFD